MIKKFFNAATSKVALPWILLIFGLTTAIIGFVVDFDNTKFNYSELFKFIGNFLIVGVLIGFLSSTAQFMNIFKNELLNVIYESEFLKNRKDIKCIWERVSKALFNSKFPEISDQLLDVIKNKYLPQNHVSYYKDYTTIITINWIDRSRQIAEFLYETKFVLVAPNKDSFDFETESWINIKDLSLGEYSVEYKMYEINNVDEKPNLVRNDKTQGNCYYNKFTSKISGKDSYLVKYKISKIYSIDSDNFISFAARYLVKNFRVQVFHPDDLELSFVNRGAPDEFEELNVRAGFMEYEYKELLLQNQGFVIVLKTK